MINAPAAILATLQAAPAVTNLTTTARIWAEHNEPPKGYAIADGPCITFKTRGGGADYSDVLLEPSVQVLCIAATVADTHELYRAIYDALQNAHNGTIKWVRNETLGQTISMQGTGWPANLSYWRFCIANA